MLRATNNCPECGESLSQKAMVCRTCGWKKPQTALQAESTSDARCSYHGTSGQCTRLGACSHSTKGGGPWFCFEHFTCESPEQGDEIIERARDEARPLGYTVRDAIHSTKERYRNTHCPRPSCNGGQKRPAGLYWAQDILKCQDFYPQRSIEIAKKILGPERIAKLNLRLHEKPEVVTT